ncbi:MAG: putative sulfate exporter family transporter [Pseudomonadota bacterium]
MGRAANDRDASAPAVRQALAARAARARTLAPGLLVALVVAIAAQFLSEHYGAPAMLMALLIGMAFPFLGEEGPAAEGIAFAAKTVLRVGVALLGARISVDAVAELGISLVSLVVAGVVLTILFGLLGARLLGRGWRLALITGGSVAICGASAAMAIAAVLPKNEHSERNLTFTVLSVTVLSTIAMIVYPLFASVFGFDERMSGVFLGATIHDVAQVVGAGFSVSEEAGETATVVKLIRVMMLAPVVLVFALWIRAAGLGGGEVVGAKRPPLVPAFVVGFLVFAALNSFGVLPALAAQWLGDLSRWALLVAIAAVGMKTSLRRIMDVGGPAVVLIIGETIFIALIVVAGIAMLG